MSDDPEFELGAVALDTAFYRDGGVRLSESEREVLGDLTGVEVLISPEGSGDEALSLAALGGQVTVYGGMIDHIQVAAEELGWDIEFASGSLGANSADEFLERDAASGDLAGRTFALIYVPWGTVDGIEDTDAWARDVSELLVTGGHLVVFDEHPVPFMLEERSGELAVTRPYWGEFVDDNQDGALDVPDQPGTGFGWAIGDLITALGDHNIATIRLEEYDTTERYLTALDLFENTTDERKALIPSSFLLVARKI